MRITIALLAAAVLVAGMFLFSAIMLKQVEVWMSQGAALSSGTRLLVDGAHLWTRFWYIGAALIAILCFAAIRMTGSSGGNDRD